MSSIHTKGLRIIWVLLFILSYFITELFGHDNTTIHPMLMAKGYDAWSNKEAIFDAIGIKTDDTLDFTIAENSPSRGADLLTAGVMEAQPWTFKEWMKAGAIDEDAQTVRCLAHFYNPLYAHYLTDPIEVGRSDSFAWASTGNSFDPGWAGLSVSGRNDECWVDARDYYLAALTSTLKTDRDANLAHTFYALGKMNHLLQDLSAPEHVRNDAHPIPSGRWFENYGRDHWADIVMWSELQDVVALDWQNEGFAKLEDFWNRGIYTGAAADLDADASGSKLIGLSEFTNGNFLGADASYNECTSGKHNFPHPALSDTNYASLGVPGNVSVASMWTGSHKVNPKSGLIRKSKFLKKERSGLIVEKHAVLNYSQSYHTKIFGYPFSSSGFPSVTIKAPDVLEQYHKIVLPKAVQYTASLLDYFFRGKLEVRITWDKDSDDYKLAITNKSGKALKGGAFTLYADKDDASETRSVVNTLEVDGGSWDESSILEDGETINATFQPSTGESKGFMLVYQGIIGLDENHGEADPFEAGKAIAAYHFQILRFNITWDIKSDIDLYLTDPNGDVIWYNELVSSLGELDNDCTSQEYGCTNGTGPENITLKQLVPGDYQVWVNFYRDWYPSDDPDGDPPEITPVNVELNTYYNSSTSLDNVSFELSEPNYGEDWPEDTIGPATQPSWYVRKLITVDENGVVTQH